MDEPDPTGALEELRELHAEIDTDAARVAARAGERIRCGRGCHECCQDGLTVFEVEAERLRLEGARVLEGEPGPPGGCAFLDGEGACRVYGSRPYVCRTQGLPLRWFSEDADGEIVDDRSICHLNVDGPDLSTLDDDDLWTIGPVEWRLGRIQERYSGGQRSRIALRDLFDAPPSDGG